MPDSGRDAAGHIAVSVRVAAPASMVWAATVDWERQGEWMLGTRVRGTVNGGRGVGGGLEAWTGVGPLGFLDTMVITEWDPPRRCVVEHTGRLVRGSGTFEVAQHGDGGSVLTWSEDLQLPGGALGRLGWPAVKPFARVGLDRSLAKLAAAVAADYAQNGEHAGDAEGVENAEHGEDQPE